MDAADMKPKNILCIRADNMGDLLMSSPAIRALKETFNSRITVLTSSMSAAVIPYIEEIDEAIIYDLPWVKNNSQPGEDHFFEVVSEIKAKQFDAAVIFTVYSQNPQPAAMLAYLAGIPVRLAYCRENPYHLLTHWVPDEEPYTLIKHQVRRDLDLVAALGAETNCEKIKLKLTDSGWKNLTEKLSASGIDLQKPWLILHPGVSEQKRQYPEKLWIETARQLAADFQLLITGGPSESELTQKIADETGVNAFSLGGKLNLHEFILLIKQAPLIVSVNTGTIHLAAAVDTPVVVLYALTNPQHLPWKVRGKVLLFDVPEALRSKNEVIRFVNQKYFSDPVPMIQPPEITAAVYEIYSGKNQQLFPEMLPLNDYNSLELEKTQIR